MTSYQKVDRNSETSILLDDYRTIGPLADESVKSSCWRHKLWWQIPLATFGLLFVIFFFFNVEEPHQRQLLVAELMGETGLFRGEPKLPGCMLTGEDMPDCAKKLDFSIADGPDCDKIKQLSNGNPTTLINQRVRCRGASGTGNFGAKLIAVDISKCWLKVTWDEFPYDAWKRGRMCWLETEHYDGPHYDGAQYDELRYYGPYGPYYGGPHWDDQPHYGTPDWIRHYQPEQALIRDVHGTCACWIQFMPLPQTKVRSNCMYPNLVKTSSIGLTGCRCVCCTAENDCGRPIPH